MRERQIAELVEHDDVEPRELTRQGPGLADPRLFLEPVHRHTITVETVGPGEPDVKYPRFVAGERRCPPEDVGGLPGLELFLDAMADPAHEEHDRLRDWYGGAYNPEDIDERFTRRAVAAIAIRRHAGKLAYEKSRPQ